jgi:hypothetical protein
VSLNLEFDMLLKHCSSEISNETHFVCFEAFYIWDKHAPGVNPEYVTAMHDCVFPPLAEGGPGGPGRGPLGGPGGFLCATAFKTSLGDW